jgi:hypothetical protein
MLHLISLSHTLIIKFSHPKILNFGKWLKFPKFLKTL